jgi:hypothetical protein
MPPKLGHGKFFYVNDLPTYERKAIMKISCPVCEDGVGEFDSTLKLVV